MHATYLYINPYIITKHVLVIYIHVECIGVFIVRTTFTTIFIKQAYMSCHDSHRRICNKRLLSWYNIDCNRLRWKTADTLLIRVHNYTS